MRNEWTFTLLYWRAGQAHVRYRVEGGKSHTYTPSWVPLLFLPPWRRGHWHDFLSLVSLIESRSLFPGQTSQPRAASASTAPRPHINNLPHLTAECTHTQTETHTRQRLPRTTTQQKHAQSGVILQVTFWLQQFAAFSSVPFKARFLNRVFRQSETGRQQVHLGWNQ